MIKKKSFLFPFLHDIFLKMLKIAALIAAVVLNATPLYDGYRMLKKKSTGSHVPLPACAMLFNASILTLYGVRIRFSSSLRRFFFKFQIFIFVTGVDQECDTTRCM